MNCFCFSILAVALLWVTPSRAQPGYTSSDGLYQVYPPAPYTYPSVTSFPQIKASGAVKQWGLSVQLGDSTQPGVWSSPLICSTPVFMACSQNQSMIVTTLGTGLVRVNYKWKGATSLTMYPGTSQVPSTLEVYMCYSDRSFDDRPWRKKNKAYPSLTQNCYFWISTNPFPTVSNTSHLTPQDQLALSGNTVYSMTFNDELPISTLFFMLWVRCTDGQVCAFESTESPSTLNSSGLYYNLPYSGGPYLFVNGYTGITPGLTAAAIVLSIFGPAFFVAYYIADNLHYTKTGRALSW